MKNTQNKKGGFTLIEILIVIGIIAILAAIVLVAINPSRQFAKANDTQRSANVNTILNAVGQYIIDQKGATSTLPALTTTAKSIKTGAANADLCALLVPTYIAALPVDPKTGTPSSGVPSTGCTSYDTGYTIAVDQSQRLITISANGEATATIAASR